MSSVVEAPDCAAVGARHVICEVLSKEAGTSCEPNRQRNSPFEEVSNRAAPVKRTVVWPSTGPEVGEMASSCGGAETCKLATRECAAFWPFGRTLTFRVPASKASVGSHETVPLVGSNVAGSSTRPAPRSHR